MIAMAARNAACRSRWTIWVLTGSACRPELGQDLGLDLGAEVAVGADGAGDLAGRDVVGRGREAASVAVDLERPAGELEPERRRLGMHRVGAAHHHRAGVLAGARDERVDEPVRASRSRSPAARNWSASAGVDDVAAGQPEVEPAALGADALGDLADERDDVVVGGRLELRDARDVDVRAGLDGRKGVRRDKAAAGLRRGTASSTWSMCSKRACRTTARPSRAACSAGSRARPAGRAGAGGSRAMSWRRCIPSHAITSAACSAPPGRPRGPGRGRRPSAPGRRSYRSRRARVGTP